MTLEMKDTPLGFSWIYFALAGSHGQAGEE